MLHFVYELVDPRTDTVVYVGITNNPNPRFQAHLSDTKSNDKKAGWIEQLRKECFEPCMRIREIVETREEALEREKYWIQEYTQQGVILTNQAHLTRHTPKGNHITLKGDTPRNDLTTSEAVKHPGLTSMCLAPHYTSQEAMQKLGVSKTKFYEYVNSGRISKKLEPGRQRGAFYAVSEVDNLAAALTGTILSYDAEEQKERTFRVARPEDAAEVARFSRAIFEPLGGHGMPDEVCEKWFKIPSLEIGHVILEKGHLIGYATILPLKHEQVLRIMRKEVRPSQIPVEELPLLEPGKPIDMFIGDIAVDPEKKHAIVYLLGKMLSYFKDLGKQGIEIEGVYATASTREGIGMCRKAGMKQMDVPDIRPNWIPFELKVKDTNNHITQDYRRALKIYKRQREKQEAKTTHLGFVDWIGIDDVLTSLQLDYKVYGPEVFLADLSYYAERVKRNPHVALAVFDSPKRERILAYISLLPLPEQTILEVLSGKRHETDIRTEEVETYERQGEYTLLAESVVVDPDHSEQLNRLLRHLTEYWCQHYPERSITKIYAQAESEAGDILIQKLFFAPLEELSSNAYMLNLKRPGASRFIQHFQHCIEEKHKK